MISAESPAVVVVVVVVVVVAVVIVVVVVVGVGVVVVVVVVVAAVAVVVLFSRQKRAFLRVSGQTVVTYTLKRRRTIQMVKFSAQTDLFLRISDFDPQGGVNY